MGTLLNEPYKSRNIMDDKESAARVLSGDVQQEYKAAERKAETKRKLWRNVGYTALAAIPLTAFAILYANRIAQPDATNYAFAPHVMAPNERVVNVIRNNTKMGDLDDLRILTTNETRKHNPNFDIDRVQAGDSVWVPYPTDQAQKAISN